MGDKTSPPVSPFPQSGEGDARGRGKKFLWPPGPLTWLKEKVRLFREVVPKDQFFELFSRLTAVIRFAIACTQIGLMDNFVYLQNVT